jgi:hypothetical protein
VSLCLLWSCLNGLQRHCLAELDSIEDLVLRCREFGAGRVSHANIVQVGPLSIKVPFCIAAHPSGLRTTRLQSSFTVCRMLLVAMAVLALVGMTRACDPGYAGPACFPGLKMLSEDLVLHSKRSLHHELHWQHVLLCPRLLLLQLWLHGGQL